uniref:Uncharacterized protein n=1 Tax=Parascaris equorum TaxID=6256 RepID=A0A914R5U8_PAREQ
MRLAMLSACVISECLPLLGCPGSQETTRSF